MLKGWLGSLTRGSLLAIARLFGLGLGGVPAAIKPWRSIAAERGGRRRRGSIGRQLIADRSSSVKKFSRARR